MGREGGGDMQQQQYARHAQTQLLRFPTQQPRCASALSLSLFKCHTYTPAVTQELHHDYVNLLKVGGQT